MNTPTLEEMLKSGVHFGHHTSKRHPGMADYIFTSRQNVSIIDLEQTVPMLEAAANVAKELAANGKQVLFVATKDQAAPVVKKLAQEASMPFVTSRWLGGLFTNFANVIEVPRKLTRLKKQRESGELQKYTKKEQLDFDKEIERLEELVGGLETLEGLPAAIFIVDMREEKTALSEAKQMKVPVIALCDSNVDPRQVQYPIPANDDAVKSIELITGVLSAAIAEGVKEAPARKAATMPRAAGDTKKMSSTANK